MEIERALSGRGWVSMGINRAAWEEDLREGNIG